MGTVCELYLKPLLMTSKRLMYAVQTWYQYWNTDMMLEEKEHEQEQVAGGDYRRNKAVNSVFCRGHYRVVLQSVGTCREETMIRLYHSATQEQKQSLLSDHQIAR
jgi:hypothetical protein